MKFDFDGCTENSFWMRKIQTELEDEKHKDALRLYLHCYAMYFCCCYDVRNWIKTTPLSGVVNICLCGFSFASVIDEEFNSLYSKR